MSTAPTPSALLLNPKTSKTLSPLSPSSSPPHTLFPFQTLPFSRNLPSPLRSSLSSSSFQSPFSFTPTHQQFRHPQNEESGNEVPEPEDEDRVLGDCVVFEDGIFEDPYLQQGSNSTPEKPRPYKKPPIVKPQDLVPDKWKGVVEEINMSKKDRRKIAQDLQYGTRLEKKRLGYMPIPRNVNVEEHIAFRETKLRQLKPVVLDNPTFPEDDQDDDEDAGELSEEEEKIRGSNTRVAPKNPRWAVYGGTLEDISEFFNSPNYEPGQGATTEGRRKLFTKDEKFLLSRRIPDLTSASSSKWLPLHTLVASGEFYLMDALLKHNVDINCADKDGWTALHRAIIAKKQAIMNYLLRESANPFACDDDGASLMHYAVQAAAIPAIKVLLLYNVDINLQDNDGWTPLHVAIQARRTDVVRLLLIKGADKTIKNKEGLTPLDLCLYSGQNTRTYEIIKLLKKLPRPVKNKSLSPTSLLPTSAMSNTTMG